MGRNGLSVYLNKMGYDGKKLVKKIYPKFLELADVKRRVTDEDLRMLVHEHMAHHEVEGDRLFRISDINYQKGRAQVTILKGGETATRIKTSDSGVIDALAMAIISAVTFIDKSLVAVELTDFQVVKGEGGSEANAWVVVRVKNGDKEAQGYSGDPDTIVATAKAFVYAINHLSM